MKQNQKSGGGGKHKVLQAHIDNLREIRDERTAAADRALILQAKIYELQFTNLNKKIDDAVVGVNKRIDDANKKLNAFIILLLATALTIIGLILKNK